MAKFLLHLLTLTLIIPFKLATIDDATLTSSLTASLDRALFAHHLALTLNVPSLDNRSKAACLDCLELSQDTIVKLNRSMTVASSREDKQTWLSAALANQQTCMDGFMDLNLNTPSSFMSNGVSKLLSNSLAVVAASSRNPNWVNKADRRLLRYSSSSMKADLTVAVDGTGDYRSISTAVATAAMIRKGGASRFVIYVKAGVYNENVEIKRYMKNITMVGDGIDVTVVTGSRNVQDGSTTFRSATFGVSGDGFVARDMTFENTAGPQKHQAVALRSSADFSVFYRCSFKGYQDTLYVHSQRQFYRNCDVYGTIDFIFGDAAAVFQSCNIYVRRPMSNQKNTITAQGRSDPNENTGISIHESVVLAAPDLNPVQGSVKTYLGRPWKKYSRTVFMRTVLGGLIEPAGWVEWSGNFGLNSLYYGEYMNSGPGADTQRRVRWSFFRVIESAAEAVKFTVGGLLTGGSWIQAAGVPFDVGL